MNHDATSDWEGKLSSSSCELTRKLHNLATLVKPIQRLLTEPERVRRRYFDAPAVVREEAREIQKSLKGSSKTRTRLI